jgi:hypothetical protein
VNSTRDKHALDDAVFLLEQAARFRRLARGILDSRTEQVLLAMAAEYEERAAALPDYETAPGGIGVTPG